MPDGGDHELPQGFYSTLGDTCYDDRPINIVKDRTRTEAAWMGGCELAGCVEPHTCSAISLPDGVNIALYSEPNFMGAAPPAPCPPIVRAPSRVCSPIPAFPRP